MHGYTKNLTFKPQPLTRSDKHIRVDKRPVLQVDPAHPSYMDHARQFDHEGFKYPYLPLFLGKRQIDVSGINLNVCRMMIMEEGSTFIHLPVELLPLEDFISDQITYQRQYYPKNANSFVYITIRTTEGDCYYQNSQTWHIDGFQGARLNRHVPEQDVIWSNIIPTEFLVQPFFLDGLNPAKHDINEYFQKNANPGAVYSGVENGVYMMTPYNVHRVANGDYTKKRVFIRLTFSPVIIADPTNTPNPDLEGYKFKPRNDVRNRLWEYEQDELRANGFQKK